MIQIEKAEEFVTDFLQSRLPSYLKYHDYFHTHDVMLVAMSLAKEEGVTNHGDLLLLKTAALFHDCGYVDSYDNHEDESCRIVERILPGLGYSEEQVRVICGMIMKTKLPSTPESILEKILCDADLDYLGRDDFWDLGYKLYQEFSALKKIKDDKEWNTIQIRFLKSHHYWTESAIKKRDKKKSENLKELETRIRS